MSDTGTNDATAETRNPRKREAVQAFGRQSADDEHSRFNKRPCSVCSAALDTRMRVSNGESTPVGNAAGIRSGHCYQHMRVGGHSRVHMGDSYGGQVFNIHNSLDLWTAMDTQRFHDAESSERVVIVQLAISVIAAALMHMFMHCLLRITGDTQPRLPSLLNLVGSRIAVFEDALGEVKHIDIDIVTDWTAFHYNLTCTFKDRPGYHRIAAAGYRLFDRSQSNQLIDPNYPPAFTDIFRRKAHIVMSVHYEWGEVPLECCPRCGLEQTCEHEGETTCKNKGCGFHYRGQVEERRIEEVDDRAEFEGDTSEHENSRLRESARKWLLKHERVHPAQFKRISVSKQPAAPDTYGATFTPSALPQDLVEPDSQTVSMDGSHARIHPYHKTRRPGAELSPKFECPEPDCGRTFQFRDNMR
jgi:hypothetical protein